MTDYFCKNCAAPLGLKIADLGFAPPSNSFLAPENLDCAEVYYPLKVYLCETCLLAQVPEYKSAREIFDADYAYFSSFSSTWVAHARDYCEMICEKLRLDSTSQVIEIAANDGYLLQFFNAKNIPNLGIEPTKSTASAARKKGIRIIEDFFTAKLAATLPKADLIVGNNVIAHVPAIRDFVRGVRLALKPRGVATFEFPHILNLLRFNQFDSIYHEHFYYYSLHSIAALFANEGLCVYDVENLATHGGSLRIYVAGFERPKSAAFSAQIALEKSHGLDSPAGYLSLQKNALNLKNDFLALLLRLKRQNARVVGFGAAAKGNTFLNFCGVRKDLLGFIVDSSPHKIGRFCPGSHIEVKPKTALEREKIDYIWIPAWNLKDEIIAESLELLGRNPHILGANLGVEIQNSGAEAGGANLPSVAQNSGEISRRITGGGGQPITLGGATHSQIQGRAPIRPARFARKAKTHQTAHAAAMERQNAAS